MLSLLSVSLTTFWKYSSVSKLHVIANRIFTLCVDSTVNHSHHVLTDRNKMLDVKSMQSVRWSKQDLNMSAFSRLSFSHLPAGILPTARALLPFWHFRANDWTLWHVGDSGNTLEVLIFYLKRHYRKNMFGACVK